MPSGSSLRRKPSQLPDDAFARLFDGLREGVYIGLVSRANDDTATLAANPHLRLIFGWPEERPAADVRPIDADRFVDPQARTEFLDRLARDGVAQNYLLRLRPR